MAAREVQNPYVLPDLAMTASETESQRTARTDERESALPQQIGERILGTLLDRRAHPDFARTNLGFSKF